jgi:hypothetical protein
MDELARGWPRERTPPRSDGGVMVMGREWKQRGLLLLLVLSSVFLHAQSRPLSGTAILSRGPYSDRGLSFISANAIPYEAGLYLFEAGEAVVYFPGQPLVFSESWEETSCRNRRLSLLSVDDAEQIYAVEDSGRQIFFHFRKVSEEIHCPFIETFLSRFSYFMTVSRDPDRLALPAVLQWAD